MGVVVFFHTSILKRFYRTNAPHYTSIVMVKLLSNDQGRSSLNQCFQTFHIVAQVEIIIISWRKTGGSPQTTAGLEAVAVLSPHLTAPQAGEICPVAHLTIREMSIAHSRSLTQTLPSSGGTALWVIFIKSVANLFLLYVRLCSGLVCISGLYKGAFLKV